MQPFLAERAVPVREAAGRAFLRGIVGYAGRRTYHLSCTTQSMKHAWMWPWLHAYVMALHEKECGEDRRPKPRIQPGLLRPAARCLLRARSTVRPRKTDPSGLPLPLQRFRWRLLVLRSARIVCPACLPS